MATPYTPRPQSRSSHLGLSNKQLSKITGTIANVRRNRQLKASDELAEEDEEGFPVNARRRRVEEREAEPNGRDPDPRRARRVSAQAKPDVEEKSFVAEASFVKAPLNTRLVNRVQVSPGIAAPKSKGKEKESDAESLHGVPLETQEALVLEDLLSVLMGIPGTYITVDSSYDPEDSPDGIPFAAHPSLDPSLRDLVDRILPLATYYTAITSFVQFRSQLDCGLVNHALCAAIRDMLNNDYLTLITQLEHLFNISPTFSLQKLWFYVHPTLHTLSLIWNLTEELLRGDNALDAGDEEDEEIDEIDAMDEELGLNFGKKSKLNVLDALEDAGIIKGGEVVAVLWDRVMNMSGDPTAHDLYLTLFRRASAPYAQMLRRWITTGQLKDPFNEFMVKESRVINRGILDSDFIDDYWERRYTLRDGSTVSGGDRRQAGVPKPRAEGGRLPGGACVPPLLDSWKQKVLLAGKYLNVIRECGIDISSVSGTKQASDPGTDKDKDKEKDKEKDKDKDKEKDSIAKVELKDVPLDDESFYVAIEEAYTFANRTLLRLLVKDQDLIPRLRSLKYYYFLSHSAYLAGFFENARFELSKPTKHASLSKLQSLYDLGLASSGGSAADGVFKGDVRLTMSNTTLWDYLAKILSIEGALGPGMDDPLGGAGDKAQKNSKDKTKEKESKEAPAPPMQAIDAITLDYTVKFPLSLVISRKAILHYQLLFRFLLHLKHAEQSLTDMWSEHKSPPWSLRSGHQELERWKLRVVLLRTRMLAYVQHVLAFATGDILEPSWKILEAKLVKAAKEGSESEGTVDQLLRDHSDFLNTCMKGCLLTTSKFLKMYAMVLHTCSRFTAYSSKMTRALEHAVSALANGDTDLATSPMDKRWEMVRKFEINFTHNQRAFFDYVQYNAMSEVALLPLVHRLNQGRSAA